MTKNLCFLPLCLLALLPSCVPDGEMSPDESIAGASGEAGQSGASGDSQGNQQAAASGEAEARGGSQSEGGNSEAGGQEEPRGGESGEAGSEARGGSGQAGTGEGGSGEDRGGAASAGESGTAGAEAAGGGAAGEGSESGGAPASGGRNQGGNGQAGSGQAGNNQGGFGIGGWGGVGTAGSSGGAVEAGSSGVGGAVGCGTPGNTRACAADGALGACASGIETCSSNGVWSECSIQPAESDACEPGDDANCNGLPNEGCACNDGDEQSCGDTVDVGPCQRGTSTCSDGVWGACEDAVYPGTRNCASSADNDCDGLPDNTVDSTCNCEPGSTQLCDAHLGMDGVGPCHAGYQTCLPAMDGSSSAFGDCVDSVGPTPEACTGGIDEDCDGIVDGADEDCEVTCPDNPIAASMVKLPATDNYCIDSTEVTRFQYETWLASEPSVDDQIEGCVGLNDDFAPDGNCLSSYSSMICQGESCGNHPQVCVDWCDATAYCAAVGKRICTPDELSNACSSHGTNTFPYGDSYQAQACNGLEYNGTSSMTVVVGSLADCQPPGDYAGIFDLSGNVSEWASQCNGMSADSYCTVSGGQFLGTQASLRCDSPGSATKHGHNPDVGIRCCYQ